MPVIIFTSPPAPAIRAAIPPEYTPHIHTERDGYTAMLIDRHAALIVVDGDLDGWSYWVTTAKSSPATRRIPVFVVTDNPDAVQAEATICGADLTLSRDEFAGNSAELIAAYARTITPEQAEQLACDCTGALPELARQGVAKFNAGEYYAQHDLFEALWVETESPVRDLYRAILQVGVAYYQIERGNHRGAKKMLLRSQQWLNILPDVCQGVDVRALRQDAAAVRAELERLPEDAIADFDRALLQPVKLVGQPRS